MQKQKKRPPVPSSVKAGGAKNLWVNSSQKTINICTYNTRSLLSNERLLELETELETIKWDIVGLGEVRRRGEGLVELQSGTMFYYKGRDNDSNTGVGFLVNKNLKKKIVSYLNAGDRVAQIVIQLNKRYRLQVIQVYAPTSTHDDDEVEEMYEEITKLTRNEKAHHKIIMGDFNAKERAKLMCRKGKLDIEKLEEYRYLYEVELNNRFKDLDIEEPMDEELYEKTLLQVRPRKLQE
eukprot:gene8020-8879_t